MVTRRTQLQRLVAIGAVVFISAATVTGAQEKNIASAQRRVTVSGCGTPVIAYLAHSKKQLWVVKNKRTEVAHDLGVKDGVAGSHWTIVTPRHETLRVEVIEVEETIPAGEMGFAARDLAEHEKSACNVAGTVVSVACQNLLPSGRSYKIDATYKSYKTCGSAESGKCWDGPDDVATQTNYPKLNCQGDGTTEKISVITCSQVPK
jgi:hypothetical protein